MLVGQKLGPFAIDKELGSGAMGTVYRGRFAATGQVVAVKVMAPGLGSTNANAAARFEREAKILKQFNHPNIVRLFGVGKSHGTRYYAMEYVQGESLDRVMARRGRMTWEEVVTLGRQLCAALQHAHEQGIVHRDLKPSNLMILPDGTLKLTDFGIAKDLDVTALTSANCTVGTAAYMSPEQCKGERELTHKSDLYSLGVVFYELLTGRKPFVAENAMDMFMQHVQGTFERPSRLVLDTPVWLDNLICQLLEKKTEHRPMDAATVHAALESIREKVEAQESAGVAAVRRRAIDKPRGDAAPDDADREAARTLLTGKGRRRRRKKAPFYRSGWFQAVGLAGLLLGAVGTLLLLLRPPSAEKLHGRAKALVESKSPEDHDKALDGPIREYLAHYGREAGPLTDEVNAWARDVKAEQCDRLIQNYERKKNGPIKFEVQDPATEGVAFKAADAEDAGELDEAAKLWGKLRQEQGDGPWGLLAARRLPMLEAARNPDPSWEPWLRDLREKAREPAAEGAAREAFVAYRAERLGDLALAADHYREAKKQSAADPSQRFWLVLASARLRDLGPRLPKTAEDADKTRQPAVREALDRAEQLFTQDRLFDSRAVCLTVLTLYGKDDAMRAEADRARDLLGRLPPDLRPPVIP